MKKHLITITTTLSAILIVSTATYAIGTLTPTGTAGDNTQYSLNDIYDKLTNFSDTPTATSSPFTLPGSVSASFHTLSEIYGLLEAEEDLVPENIKDGTTIFGIEGELTSGVSYPTQWSADNPAGYVDWATAMSYCDTLEEGGYTDWRLPTIIELNNAYLTSNPGNSLGFQTLNYWSNTSRPSYSRFAYAFDMYGGISSAPDKTNSTGFLTRCAR